MVRALILAALAWFALGAAPQNVGDHAKQPEAKAHGNVQAGAPKAAPSAQPPKKAENPNPPCEKGEDNRRSDLCAQWKAADAANLAARVALWVGVVGLLVGALTLAAAIAAALFARKAALETERGAQAAMQAVEATKEANRMTRSAQLSEQLAAKLAAMSAQSEREEADKRAEAAYAIAKRTADAAAAQVEVVQETAKHELRAYVGVKEIMLSQIVRPRPSQPPLTWDRVHVTLKNFGKTPARITFDADAQFGGKKPQPRSLPKPRGAAQILQPGRTVRKEFEVERKDGGDQRFYVILRIFYTDIYGTGYGHRLDYSTPRGEPKNRGLHCTFEEETVHPPPPDDGDAAG
jgi:hypothetical protein